jgi:hypothetical protein
MGVGFLNKTDLYLIHNYVQNSGHVYVKEFIIDSLREFFSQDSYYRYVRDAWGFPLTPSASGLEPDAGINDSTTSRIFIGEYTRRDVQFYPSLLIKSGGYRYTPIAMNRNKFSVHYSPIKYFDGYGNETIINTATSINHNGAWEGSISIDILARDSRTRTELSDICMLFFTDYHMEDFQNAGILIKSSSLSGESETEDRNDKIYKSTITLDIRSEWERSIPIENIVNAINLCVEIGNTNDVNVVVAPNLTIETSIELSEALLNI